MNHDTIQRMIEKLKNADAVVIGADSGLSAAAGFTKRIAMNIE